MFIRTAGRSIRSTGDKVKETSKPEDRSDDVKQLIKFCKSSAQKTGAKAQTEHRKSHGDSQNSLRALFAAADSSSTSKPNEAERSNYRELVFDAQSDRNIYFHCKKLDGEHHVLSKPRHSDCTSGLDLIEQDPHYEEGRRRSTGSPTRLSFGKRYVRTRKLSGCFSGEPEASLPSISRQVPPSPYHQTLKRLTDLIGLPRKGKKQDGTKNLHRLNGFRERPLCDEN